MNRIFLCLLIISTCAFADQTATTEDGRTVILKDDGTWSYVKQSQGSAAKEDEFADANRIIGEHCRQKWSTDFSMQSYCRDKQTDALHKLKKGKPEDINPADYALIHKQCKTKWTDDYEMQEYCENQQFEAIRKLRKE